MQINDYVGAWAVDVGLIDDKEHVCPVKFAYIEGDEHGFYFDVHELIIKWLGYKSVIFINEFGLQLFTSKLPGGCCFSFGCQKTSKRIQNFVGEIAGDLPDLGFYGGRTPLGIEARDRKKGRRRRRNPARSELPSDLAEWKRPVEGRPGHPPP